MIKNIKVIVKTIKLYKDTDNFWFLKIEENNKKSNYF